LSLDGGYYVGGYSGLPGGTKVIALGSPLFEATEVDDADVYVTLAAADLGLWNPFSWYPYVPPTKWAAIVTERSTVDDVSVLFDRGYGWVYLTSEAGLETKSTIMTDLLDEIEATATRRKLQARRLEASAPFWGCDDTLFECKPTCMKTTGVVTTKVSDTLCASAPMSPCSCKCFHQAQWTCEANSTTYVCKAKYGSGDLKKVGDKVCGTRGAPKPVSSAEQRIASTCEPVTEMRGSAPTAQCLAEWAAAEPQFDPAPTTAAPTKEHQPVQDKSKVAVEPLIQESLATTIAVVALALYA
jgi:hypothetical protein